jgi:hypothetical protein
MAITFEGSVSGVWSFDYCFSFEEKNRLMYHSNRNLVALIPKKNQIDNQLNNIFDEYFDLFS